MISYIPLLAQGAGGQIGIAVGGNPLIIFLAISAILGGVGLYFVRNWRPELSRDHDIFLSAVALIYGLVLLFFSFKMDQVTQFAQLLLVGFAWWFGFETLSLRQIVSTQARRSAIRDPIVDDDPTPQDYDYPMDYDTGREIPERRNVRQQPRQMRPYRPSELAGDVETEVARRPPRRNRTRPSAESSVIDVLDEDIKPVAPRKPRTRSGEETPPRRRKSNPERGYPDIDASEREDY